MKDAFEPELELGFSPLPLDPSAPVSQVGVEDLDRRVLHLSFTTESPERWWHDQHAAAARLLSDGVGRMLWTAPFIPTVPGTDTYADQLW